MKEKLLSLKESLVLIFRLILLAVYLAFHLAVMRPTRTALFSLQLNESVILLVNNAAEFSFYELGTRLVYIEQATAKSDRIWFYRVPFGSFFLLGISGLILIGADLRTFYFLIAVHAFIFAASWGVLAADFTAHPWLLNIPDFLSRYMAPLSSIGIIPIAYIFRRAQTTNI